MRTLSRLAAISLPRKGTSRMVIPASTSALPTMAAMLGGKPGRMAMIGTRGSSNIWFPNNKLMTPERAQRAEQALRRNSANDTNQYQ